MRSVEDRELEEKVRREAIIRTSVYSHPQVRITHEPITHRECEQLHKQLKGAVNDKIDMIKRHQDIEDLDKIYSQKYMEFAEACMRNQIRETQMCRDIKEMHQMADLLLHPPAFQQQMQLYNKISPSEREQQMLDDIFLRYQKAYKAGERVEEDEAEEVIRRAEHFLLKENDY